MLEQIVHLPFSPKDYPLPTQYVVIFNEGLRRLNDPTRRFTAEDGEIVAVTTKTSLPESTIILSGHSVTSILFELRRLPECQGDDSIARIYTGPQPPKPVGERVPKLSPAM